MARAGRASSLGQSSANRRRCCCLGRSPSSLHESSRLTAGRRWSRDERDALRSLPADREGNQRAATEWHKQRRRHSGHCFGMGLTSPLAGGADRSRRRDETRKTR